MKNLLWICTALTVVGALGCNYPGKDDDDDHGVDDDDDDVVGDDDDDDDDDTDDDDDSGGTDADGDGYPAGQDCNDNAPSIHPGADEHCDGVDEDCDGVPDNDPVDGDYYATDLDGDGFGAQGSMTLACSGVENQLDCDDYDYSEPVVADAVNGTVGGTGTIEQPVDRIQRAIDLAMACVVAMPGIYNEAIDFTGKDLQVLGTGLPGNTTIDASGTAQPVVTFNSHESSAAVLAGFTLTDGTGHLEQTSYSWPCTSVTQCTEYYDTYCGGGVFIDGADPTLRDLNIDHNQLQPSSVTTVGDETWFVESFGGGLCLLNSSPSISRVRIAHNYADQGGAMYVDENSIAELEQAFVIANAATDGGGIEIDRGRLTMTNVASAFNGASGDGGGLLSIVAQLTATNVTFAVEEASHGAGLYLSGASSGTVKNTIVYGAVDGEGVLQDNNATFSGAYNDVYDNAGGNYAGLADPTGTSGNISAVPDFVSVTDDGNDANDDLHLRPSSACIDAGDPSAAYNDPDSSRNDMGAFGGPGGDWN